jgi:hypothetical protein
MIWAKFAPAVRVAEVPDWLAVIRVGRKEWRISDSRIDASVSGHLIGFVEKLPTGRFELVWITEPIRWGYSDTFAEAVAGMADRTAFVGASDRRESFGAPPRPSAFHRIRRRAAITGGLHRSDVA